MELAYRCGAISGKDVAPPCPTACYCQQCCCRAPLQYGCRCQQVSNNMCSAVRHVYPCGGRQPAGAARHHPARMEGAAHHPH